ncbi:hypothetical protein PR048_016833 [Dryococelus australis]|uniref:Uncharacterized protein n=1 Tax=Dryococelus australis TaxID=614101 RepID=A0ABQ9H7W7_9NEOP|nr:hypothetical protein PR048_016833 [Dryococelus australis]
MQARGKREIPEKTCRSAASSGTITTCKNPEATPMGIEPGSPRFGEEVTQHIKVPQVSLPDLSIPEQLGRRQHFSLFLPYHRYMASKLVSAFMGLKTKSDLQAVAACCRDKLNPYMFNYALSVAILHRSDTKNLVIPGLIDVFPEKFVRKGTLAEAKEELGVVDQGSRNGATMDCKGWGKPAGQQYRPGTIPTCENPVRLGGRRVPVVIPQDYTASNLEPEHRIAYFREDPGLNLHHWHWHLVYPFSGPREIVAKDRRGELFFYHHQQIMAR